MDVKTKMTAIADQIRTLTEVTGKLSLDDMAENLSDASVDLDTAAELIQQIIDLLINNTRTTED